MAVRPPEGSVQFTDGDAERLVWGRPLISHLHGAKAAWSSQTVQSPSSLLKDLGLLLGLVPSFSRPPKAVCGGNDCGSWVGEISHVCGGVDQ